MAMELCASCKQKVEDGAIQCWNCGARLDRPGGFQQVLGWIFVSVATVPLAVSMVTTGEKNLIPLVLGVCILAFGIVNVVVGRMRAASVPPTTARDTSDEIPPAGDGYDAGQGRGQREGGGQRETG